MIGYDIEVFREVARRGRFDVDFVRLDHPSENESRSNTDVDHLCSHLFCCCSGGAADAAFAVCGGL